MRMLMLMCDETIADNVRDILGEFCEQSCFLEIPKAHASIGTEKRMDTPAFPGTANLFLAALGEEQIPQLKERARQFEISCPHQCCLKIVALEAREIL